MKLNKISSKIFSKNIKKNKNNSRTLIVGRILRLKSKKKLFLCLKKNLLKTKKRNILKKHSKNRKSLKKNSTTSLENNMESLKGCKIGANKALKTVSKLQ